MRVVSLLVFCWLTGIASASNDLLGTTQVTSNMLIHEVATSPTYGEMRDLAVREDTPLVVWLGYPPHQADVALQHWHTTDTDWGGFKGPGVVVGIPHDGELYVAGFLDATQCDTTGIRALIARTRAVWKGTVRIVSAPFRAMQSRSMMGYSSTMMAAPMRIMRAGRGAGGC